MRLNIKTDYCLRVLIYLQEKPGKTKIQEIADTYGISKNHLSVAVNKLSELNYVKTTQGPKGGIEFNPECSELSVGSLVKQVESFDVVECFNPEDSHCTLIPYCRLKKMLRKATDSFLDELDGYKIKDLI